MKKVLVIAALFILASCSSTAPEQTPTVDSTAVVTATVSVDSTLVTDSCAVDTVK